MSAMSEKRALRQRVRDLACGAFGDDFDQETEFATAEFLSRFIVALKITFGEEGRNWMWEPRSLHHFDTIESATNFLFTQGIRANGKEQS